VYAAGAARAVVVLGLSVFAGFHIERLYETREIEAILSRAISRPQFVLAYWLGLAVIAVFVVVPVALVIAVFQLSAIGTAYWAASLVLESLIVVGFALFAGLTFGRAIPTVFATLGFYALSRMVGELISLVELGRQGGVNRVANPIAETLALFVPRLDLFADTRWLVYGPDTGETLTIPVIQAAIYVPLLILAGTFDLRRKEF
jgi:ABC-type transport system involved in multi-copper enzyme maturation permease subunit